MSPLGGPIDTNAEALAAFSSAAANYGVPNAGQFNTPGHLAATLASVLNVNVLGQALNVKDPRFGAVGDGVTDDTAAIQAALTIGGDVVLPSGSYRVTAPLTIAVADTRFLGRGTLVYVGAGVPLTVSAARCEVIGVRINTTGATGAYAMSVSGTDALLQGVRVTGAAADAIENGRVELTATAHRSAVRGCTFDTTFTSLSCAADFCTIEGNTFLNYRLGVYLNQGATNTVVRGNRFPSKAGAGITQGYDAILMEGTTGTVVVANTVGACREHGIYVAAGTPINSGVTITGNTVMGCEADGIKVLGADATTGAAQDVTISGNTVADGDSTSGGITVGFCRRVTIIGNAVTDQNRGIFVRGGTEAVEVIGNVVCRNTASGIEVRDLSGANVGTLVAENTANENDTAAGGFPGIYVLCSGGYASTDLAIRGNVTSDYQGGPTQQNGIVIADVTGGSSLARVVIENNTGRGNVGALVDGAGLADISGLVVRNNFDGSSTSVASAATITLPLDAPRVTVTGTTGIASITASYSSNPVTLIFTGALTVTDGSNLRLNGNLVTTADDTLTLVCDGTNWYEVARSAN